MTHLIAARIDDAARRARIRRRLTRWAREICPEIAPHWHVRATARGPWLVASVGADPDAAWLDDALCGIGWPGASPRELARLDSGSVPGAGAIARWTEHALEVATDTFASRSWFVGALDGVAVASTSQRLATRVLGAFAPDEDVSSWFLTTGVLPPGGSHNRHLRALAPATVARCDATGRPAWCTTTDRPAWRPTTWLRDAQVDALEAAIERSVGSLASATGWVCPLSGGVDSRALLLFWQGERPPTVTWGVRAALDEPWSDAVIARRAAEALGTSNRYIVVEPSEVSPDEVLRRFRDVGEGRIDHIGGYSDGFALFRTLRDEGVSAIVRGDEAFGWSRSLSEEDLLRSLGLSFGERVRGLPASLRERVRDQQLPPALRRQTGESLVAWRDRLYASCRAPTVLAALNALKAPFVEIANPFLHRDVAEVVRTLPPRWRTDKRLFRQLVVDKGIDVPFARTPAIAAPGDLLGGPDVRAMLSTELERDGGSLGLGDAATEWLVERAARPGAPRRGRREWMESVRHLVPSTLKAPARVLAGTPAVPGRRWAFRAWLAASTHRALAEDAAQGSRAAVSSDAAD